MSRCRLKEWYNIVVRPDLMAKMQYTNTHQVPKLSKVTVQITTKQAATGLNNAVPAAFMLELVTGQTASLTRVKKANALFKVRPGFLEGAMVSLEGDQMYHFLDRVVTQVLPRITDFTGLKSSSFDGNGNYTLAIADWSNFLEVEAQHSNLQHLNMQKSPGVGVQIHTNAKTDEEAKLLLTAMRFPFRPD
mmetsp:Transcript_13570/g.27548  ORF Transcript_13570/g.27548 Transcript_13570/m.27548 type:complete len:190 (+) Transcript_13570:33-602(+)|eukprot:CAMPEP_0119070892 /NCGR_PEP_ID=MMETSP1178-20130426/44619_1 /TAXON_ID=33656 /ORGANISM="unid sp, Strain CCMP2000" /LENGTH=189 /DNA_ID=CAMNT_0007052769 /DNA_START=33 /DNA_END=602 /DNA_ORIENTATION=+